MIPLIIFDATNVTLLKKNNPRTERYLLQISFLHWHLTAKIPYELALRKLKSEALK